MLSLEIARNITSHINDDDVDIIDMSTVQSNTHII